MQQRRADRSRGAPAQSLDGESFACGPDTKGKTGWPECDRECVLRILAVKQMAAPAGLPAARLLGGGRRNVVGRAIAGHRPLGAMMMLRTSIGEYPQPAFGWGSMRLHAHRPAPCMRPTPTSHVFPRCAGAIRWRDPFKRMGRIALVQADARVRRNSGRGVNCWST